MPRKSLKVPAAHKPPVKPRKEKVARRTLSFSPLECDDDQGLLLMPIARPRDGNLHKAFSEELRILRGDNFSVIGAPKSLFDADEQGRMLWGWSPWRAQQHALTWEQWDAFCLRWFNLSVALPERTSCFDKEGLNTLCREVELLEQRGLIRCVRFPFGYRQQRVEQPVKRKRRSDSEPEAEDVDEVILDQFE